MTVAVREPVVAMSSCLDGLRGTLGGLDDNGITQTLRDIEKLTRETQSVMLGVVAEIEARGIAVREGFSTTQRLLAGMLQLSAAEARMRVEHAVMVGARRTITGQTLAPRLPATAAALAAGQIGTGQLRVITRPSRRCPHRSRHRRGTVRKRIWPATPATSIPADCGSSPSGWSPPSTPTGRRRPRTPPR
ncbi:MAG: DUF222 domain-containing protein [Pseudonocardiales bacterium]|nr:DUF222 domain-containing protein [Pseudonocardiales bacterium]